MLGRASTDERDAKKAAKERQKAVEAAQAEVKRRAQARERMRDEFFRTPAGEARLAFDRGDHVFQFAFNVAHQDPIIVAMIGSRTSTKTADPTAILNSVCHEGWRLLNGSFVFQELGSQSRDKFMSSGQNVAVHGNVVGFHLFERCEANKADVGDPWDDGVAEEWVDEGTGQIVRRLTAGDEVA